MEIRNSLADQARVFLQAQFEAFSVGAQGNFPYYFQLDNKEFNSLTYKWINKHVESKPQAYEPSSISNEDFIKIWNKVFPRIAWELSSGDRTTLNGLKDDVKTTGDNLVGSWKRTYNVATITLEQVLDTICNRWANPPTTVPALQVAQDLYVALNAAPVSGQQGIIPVLALYLSALSKFQSMDALAPRYNSQLANAGKNATNPSTHNGGLKISGQQELVPSWDVNSSLPAIIAGLQGSNAAKLTTTVQLPIQEIATQYSVSLDGGAPFLIPYADFFTLTVGADANYFRDHIVSSTNKPVALQFTFHGVTPVRMTPTALELSSLQGWYWLTPVRDAVKNADSDVTGYKFKEPQTVDLSAKGPFGWLQTVAISQYPTITITAQTDTFEEITTTVNTASVKGSFLGVPLFLGSSNYSHAAVSDADEKTVTITLTPPAGGLGASQAEKRGWVLGSITSYPGI
jgi:hypothetical protein